MHCKMICVACLLAHFFVIVKFTSNLSVICFFRKLFLGEKKDLLKKVKVQKDLCQC